VVTWVDEIESLNVEAVPVLTGFRAERSERIIMWPNVMDGVPTASYKRFDFDPYSSIRSAALRTVMQWFTQAWVEHRVYSTDT